MGAVTNMHWSAIFHKRFINTAIDMAIKDEDDGNETNQNDGNNNDENRQLGDHPNTAQFVLKFGACEALPLWEPIVWQQLIKTTMGMVDTWQKSL